ncbi:MAG TPA: hypothetical protein VJR30_05795 [Bradyrhizobium sp.]|nr:hypothetical protein [Bradyrhizobium sp.]
MTASAANGCRCRPLLQCSFVPLPWRRQGWSGLAPWGLTALFVAGGIAGGLVGTRSAKSLSERRGA